MTDANLMDANCIHGVTWWECEQCEQPEPCDRPHLTDADQAVLDAAGACVQMFDLFPDEYPTSKAQLAALGDLIAAVRARPACQGSAKPPPNLRQTEPRREGHQASEVREQHGS